MKLDIGPGNSHFGHHWTRAAVGRWGSTTARPGFADTDEQGVLALVRMRGAEGLAGMDKLLQGLSSWSQ